MDQSNKNSNQLNLFQQKKEIKNIAAVKIEETLKETDSNSIVIDMQVYFARQNEDRVKKLADKLTAHLR